MQTLARTRTVKPIKNIMTIPEMIRALQELQQTKPVDHHFYFYVEEAQEEPTPDFTKKQWESIERGKADVQAGRTISHTEMKKRISSLREGLEIALRK